MIAIENHCVGCAAFGLRCVGRSCTKRSVEVHRCDRCGDEVDPDDLFRVGGEDICYDCRLEILSEEDEK